MGALGTDGPGRSRVAAKREASKPGHILFGSAFPSGLRCSVRVLGAIRRPQHLQAVLGRDRPARQFSANVVSSIASAARLDRSDKMDVPDTEIVCEIDSQQPINAMRAPGVTCPEAGSGAIQVSSSPESASRPRTTASPCAPQPGCSLRISSASRRSSSSATSRRTTSSTSRRRDCFLLSTKFRSPQSLEGGRMLGNKVGTTTS